LFEIGTTEEISKRGDVEWFRFSSE
jgi:hypothetical protein